MTVEAQLATVGSAVVSSVIYSLMFYIKKNSSKQPEEYDFKKLGATVLVGVGVGISFVISGIEITQANFQEQIVGMAGTVAIVEAGLKIVWRRAKRRLEKK